MRVISLMTGSPSLYFSSMRSWLTPGRSSSLEITCPGPEAALALVGAARRLGVQAKAREVRGVDRVVVRDGDAIGALLTRLGAHESLLAWEERRMRREVRATANRLANFDDANLRRTQYAVLDRVANLLTLQHCARRFARDRGLVESLVLVRVEGLAIWVEWLHVVLEERVKE